MTHVPARRHGYRLIAALATMICAFCSVADAGGATIDVRAGGDLQAALDSARPGDVILLEPGARFVGNFVLPVKPGSSFITLRSAASDGELPSEHGRITPAHARLLPKLQSPNAEPALRTAPGAHHWRIQFVEFLANARGEGDIIQLGSGSQSSLSAVPHTLVIDRCLLRGDQAAGQKRGIALNSASTTIRGSHIGDIKARGQDSQAIAGWNGPGPFVIEGNYLEAAGENILFGGADPAIFNLVPSDITVRGNHLSKPVSWRGGQWTVKNLFELKNARNVLIEANLMEYNWGAAQSGHAILFTPRNQDGKAPWSTVEEVTFRYNVVRHVAAGINILGRDNNHPSEQARRIRILHNLFYDVDGKTWGGNGDFLLVGDGPADVVIDHNTVLHSGNLVTAHGGSDASPTPIHSFLFTNNLARHNAYGIIGTGRAPGNSSVTAYFPGGVVRNNVIAGGQSSQYPAGNMFPSTAQFMAQFSDPSAHDYRLVAGSNFRGAGTEASDLGADMTAIAFVFRDSPPVSPREAPMIQLPPDQR
jgi:hypothetical protein